MFSKAVQLHHNDTQKSANSWIPLGHIQFVLMSENGVKPRAQPNFKICSLFSLHLNLKKRPKAFLIFEDTRNSSFKSVKP